MRRAKTKITFSRISTKIVVILLTVSYICGSALPLFTVEAQAATTVTRKYGDVNWDGEIDSRDTLRILSHISASTIPKNKKEHPDWILSGDDFRAADVNCDGTIDSRDTLRVQEYIAASTVANIRNKHPEWVRYLQRSFSYNVNLKFSTNKVNVNLNGNKTCTVNITHNYNRRPCTIKLYKQGNCCSFTGKWNPAGNTYTLTITGKSQGTFLIAAELYDTRKKVKVGTTGEKTANILTVNVSKLSVSIPINKKITVFRQTTNYYKKIPYGTDENRKKMTMYTSACGVFSVVNAVYYLKNTKINPESLAKFALTTKDIKKRGGKLYTLRYPGGTSDNLARVFCVKNGSKYGIKFIKSVKSVPAAKSYLQKGNVAIAHVSGHFVALVNYNSKTGKYLVLDSYPSKGRGTLNGYRWMTAKQFAGKMALSSTGFNNGCPIQIIGRR